MISSSDLRVRPAGLGRGEGFCRGVDIRERFRVGALGLLFYTRGLLHGSLGPSNFGWVLASERGACPRLALGDVSLYPVFCLPRETCFREGRTRGQSTISALAILDTSAPANACS